MIFCDTIGILLTENEVFRQDRQLGLRLIRSAPLFCGFLSAARYYILFNS